MIVICIASASAGFLIYAFIKTPLELWAIIVAISLLPFIVFIPIGIRITSRDHARKRNIVTQTPTNNAEIRPKVYRKLKCAAITLVYFYFRAEVLNKS